jgi:hypothetical protein
MFMNDETNTGELSRMIDEINRPSDYDKREACAALFASLHGWKPGAPFSIPQLHRGTAPSRQNEMAAGMNSAYDHPEYLHQRGKPRGIVVQVYHLPPLLDAASTDGLHVRVLARQRRYC